MPGQRTWQIREDTQEPRVKRLLQWLPQSFRLVKQPIGIVTEAMNDSAKTLVEMADTLGEPVRALLEGDDGKTP